jgi:hypothetical protein
MASAVVYGILHDQITARLCVEYFTIGHPPVFGTDDPTLLGIGWGILATWWGGLLLGIPMALAARAGRLPKRNAASLVRPIGILLAVMACSAAVAGLAGWFLSSHGTVFLVGYLAKAVPQEKHVLFLTDAWAHSASYVVGFVGGAMLVVSVWRSRRRHLLESKVTRPMDQIGANLHR